MSNPENKPSREPVTVKLDYPFEWGEGTTITEVEIPRPTALHMRGLNTKKLEAETDEMFKLLQKLIGQPPKFLDKMDFSDVTKLMKVVERFLENGPTTGSIT